MELLSASITLVAPLLHLGLSCQDGGRLPLLYEPWVCWGLLRKEIFKLVSSKLSLSWSHSEKNLLKEILLCKFYMFRERLVKSYSHQVAEETPSKKCHFPLFTWRRIPEG